MQRYYIKKNQIIENKIVMNEEDSYHIVKVMRMNIQDQIEVTDEEFTYLCSITALSLKQVEAEIVLKLEEKRELPVLVTIAQGQVIRNKMEQVIEQIAMLGASDYIFFPMERSTIKIADEKMDKKLMRLEKIAKEACEVAHRTKLLKVENLRTWQEFLQTSSNYDVCLYAYEKTDFTDSTFKQILKKLSFQNKILILIGPEGGISEKEVVDLNKFNFIPITLGPRILRTEVAPQYVMASIGYELENED